MAIQASASVDKMQLGTGNDWMVHKRLGTVSTSGNATVFDHFEGWCCYVGYGGGGFGGTVMCGEDRTDFTVTPTGHTQGYSFSKSGSQSALVINAGSTNAIVGSAFIGFAMRF